MQEIKCNVECCKYNDKAKHCNLANVVVGSDTPKSAHSKSETECVSFDRA
jgi:hypothetical protein